MQRASGYYLLYLKAREEKQHEAPGSFHMHA
jgi:hypothetical protein